MWSSVSGPLIGAGGAAAGGPWSAAAIGALQVGSTLWTNWQNRREARENRAFQERMSSTAHSREMRDLRVAGINPGLRQLSGAPGAPGDRAEMEEPLSKGVASALMVRRAQSEIKLIEAQARTEQARDLLTRHQAADINMRWEAGHWDVIRAQRELMEMNVEERRLWLEHYGERVKKELEQITAGARLSEARAILEELMHERYKNLEKFEEMVGEAGPMIRFFIEVIRGARYLR